MRREASGEIKQDMKYQQTKRDSMKRKGKSYREKLRQRRVPKLTNFIWMLLGKCSLWLTIYLGCFYDGAQFGLCIWIYSIQHLCWLASMRS